MATTERDADLILLMKRLCEDSEVLAVAAGAASAIGPPVTHLPVHEVNRHIVSLLEAIIAVLEQNPQEMAAAGARADQLAIDRARQGVSLEIILDAVQSARAVLLPAIIDGATDLMPLHEVLALMVRLDNAAGHFQNRMIVLHQREATDQRRTRHQAKLDALREFLAGGSPAWANEAGLDTSTGYHCILVDVSAPIESDRLESMLDAGDGISGIVHGYLCRISTKLPDPERLQSMLTIISPRVPVSRLPSTYRMCREALAANRASGRSGTQPLIDSTLRLALVARPDMGRLLRGELLAALDPGDDFHRQLAVTALAYIQHGGNTERTASALHVHRNTVKYRIRRFVALVGVLDEAEGFGRSLAAATNWWWALSTWLDDSPEGHPV